MFCCNGLFGFAKIESDCFHIETGFIASYAGIDITLILLGFGKIKCISFLGDISSDLYLYILLC